MSWSILNRPSTNDLLQFEFKKINDILINVEKRTKNSIRGLQMLDTYWDSVDVCYARVG